MIPPKRSHEKAFTSDESNTDSEATIPPIRRRNPPRRKKVQPHGSTNLINSNTPSLQSPFSHSQDPPNEKPCNATTKSHTPGSQPLQPSDLYPTPMSPGNEGPETPVFVDSAKSVNAGDARHGNQCSSNSNGGPVTSFLASFVNPLISSFSSLSNATNGSGINGNSGSASSKSHVGTSNANMDSGVSIHSDTPAPSLTRSSSSSSSSSSSTSTSLSSTSSPLRLRPFSAKEDLLSRTDTQLKLLIQRAQDYAPAPDYLNTTQRGKMKVDVREKVIHWIVDVGCQRLDFVWYKFINDYSPFCHSLTPFFSASVLH
jgi:hypothetical protein